MKIVILAGGLGTRLSEETVLKPKPMVQIGNEPILWHIMKIFSHYGYNDFIICLGYKGNVIKEYFLRYHLYNSNITIDLQTNTIDRHSVYSEPWKVTLIDTGLHTMTGGRLKRIQQYIGNETFMMTYGDGLADVNIKELVDFHIKKGQIGTLTAVQPAGRFGALSLDNNNDVYSFQEKPKGDGSWINGGFFVLEPEVFNYISGDETVFEQSPLQTLAADGQLNAFHHYGFWFPMDKLSDRIALEEMWNRGEAKWKIWKD